MTVAAEIDWIDLSPAELAAMMQEASMNLLLVDTRDRVAFAAASIAGAYHVDDPQRPALDAPGFHAIVLIGDHTRPAQIGSPSALYAEHGSSHLFRLTDGPPQWRAANLPVATFKPCCCINSIVLS